MSDQQPTPDPLNELAACQAKCEEYLNGWKRAQADFINYKKEENERLAAMTKYIQLEFVYKLLPLLDNLNLVEKNYLSELAQNAHVKGLLQIKTQLEDFLKAQGVEEIKALGEKFDPNFHEVIQTVTLPEKESGTIIEVIQKGYLVEGNLFRPAKVKVVQ